MSNIAIHTENLGKRYRLGATVDFSRTFREALLGLPKYFYQLSKTKAQRLLDKNEYPKDTPKGTFWALRDINLDISHGDVVGIIGRNGAGKSTLLKILSKITSPTTGIARINGRVGSLLEVGTGFHPELSGRENIYLNGSILGMRKAEIQKKFDEIVAFAEVEQFLDTPIKRYSSGMQVRLAFAVAAHLEPEILIVDEVLAVGDAAFQKKCLGKMEDVSKEGRTVLFVSHNMGAVQKLCKSAILLEKGVIEYIDTTNKVIEKYVSSNINNDKFEIISNLRDTKRSNELGTLAKFEECFITNSKNEVTNSLLYGEPFSIYFKIFTEYQLKQLDVLFSIKNYQDQRIATGTSLDKNIYYYVDDSNYIYGKFFVNNLILHPGRYNLHVGIRRIDVVEDALSFEVSDISYNPNNNYKGVWGFVNIDGEWSIVSENQYKRQLKNEL